MIYTILGLSNPEKEYSGTRHNVGEMFVNFLAKSFEADPWKENAKAKVRFAKAKVGKHTALFLLPEVFMNNNGKVLLPYIKSKKDAERLIVIYDDLDLPLGRMKMSFGRNSGGHKGLESVMKTIKTKDFIRIRVGVSPANSKGVAKKPSGEEAVIKFILGKFKESESEVLKREKKKVVEALQNIIENGFEFAMGEFNR